MTDLHACVDFLQRLIQTPSLPGEEGAIAQLVMTEMDKLGYDEVFSDEAGNVIGCIRGNGDAQPVMLNTHLDHVDVGEHNAWPHPPFGAEIHDDRIWGRGAVDIKGPLAAQVYGAARLKSKGLTPPGDVYVSGVVYEEIGGLGARHLATHLPPMLIVIGEPSNNELRRGHRGRLELQLHVKGKSVHASRPRIGVNPLEVVSKFILLLGGLEMAEDVDLGRSTVVPTLLKTDQISSNVVPGEVWLTLDWRNVPNESEEEVIEKLNRLAQQCLIPGASASVYIPTEERVCYTDFSMEIPACSNAFVTRSNDEILLTAENILADTFGTKPPVDLWRFATDGGHFIRAGAQCIGFAPGDDKLAHTVDEHIPISQIDQALDGYEALAREWGLKNS